MPLLMARQSCQFCPDNWLNLQDMARPNAYKYGGRWVRTRIIEPLNPVTPGHALVICELHTEHAAVTEHYPLSGILMQEAVAYVDNLDCQANIITSIGPDATQTVFHTHLHIVPRRNGDGLMLPWSGLQLTKLADRWERQAEASSLAPYAAAKIGCEQQLRKWIKTGSV